MDTKAIILAGVGGQGIILASEIISDVLYTHGYDVKKNEIHGMSQRGGSVVSFIRYGNKVYSPVPAYGDVDILVSFEKLEAVRNLSYLKPDGWALIADVAIDPVPVLLGSMKYPENISDMLDEKCSNFKILNVNDAAKEAGSIKSVNVVIIGHLSNFFTEIRADEWKKSIEKLVKPAFIELNLKAFELGRSL